MPGGTTPAQVAERFKADKQIFADAMKGHGDQAGIAIAGGPNGAFDSEFDYVMKIYVDYVTNLLYKIPHPGSGGDVSGDDLQTEPGVASRDCGANRTVGGPDPDRQGIYGLARAVAAAPCPTAGDASVGPRPKNATVERREGSRSHRDRSAPHKRGRRASHARQEERKSAPVGAPLPLLGGG